MAEHHGLALWDLPQKPVCSFTFPEELTHLCCSLDLPPPTLNPQDERNGATQLMSGPLNPGTSLSPSCSASRIRCAQSHYAACLRNRLKGEAEGTDGVNTLKEQTHSTHPPLKLHLHGQLCLTWETTTHIIPEPSLYPGMTSSPSSPSCLFLLSFFPATLCFFPFVFSLLERLKASVTLFPHPPLLNLH